MGKLMSAYVSYGGFKESKRSDLHRLFNLNYSDERCRFSLHLM
ncbi:uncharacterized protein G2W53_042807 [Senna tora]|uniref:Uncharacterized protein n=1 Tax=Senna tora TaxID=362788 RepID=A0A834SHU2_9FABA|nr:uncharacterized protein G2W53_042807 [Senna tora]